MSKADITYGANLVISFQRSLINGIIENTQSMELGKERDAIIEICYECSQLIESARLWALEQIKEKSNGDD